MVQLKARVCEVCDSNPTLLKCWCGIPICKKNLNCMSQHLFECTQPRNGGPGFNVVIEDKKKWEKIKHDHGFITIPPDFWEGNGEKNPNYGAESGQCCFCNKQTTTKQCKECYKWICRPTESRDCMEKHLAQDHNLVF